MTPRLLYRLGMLALPLAAASPIMAQSSTGVVAPDDPGWAHPPYMVLAGPFDRRPIKGYTPSQMTGAYGFSSIANKGAGQTIALVDAYNNPDAASDLTTFDKEFGLPACTIGDGCFSIVYASGEKPENNISWAGESSLDIECAHAIAPEAKIMLVEAASDGTGDLMTAVKVAVSNGATVVSMSWGGVEIDGETYYDSAYFNVTGVIFCASAGDSGHGAEYPAASPYVVAVGGTALHISGDTWVSETAWKYSGGGESNYETEPAYQTAAGIQSSGKRGIPDVAWDANGNTGVAAYSKYGFGGWAVVDGTSIGSPSWAGLFAIVESSRAEAGAGPLTVPQTYLYPGAEGDYHDIVSGSNGTCGALCTAGPGYDFVTGLGSPQANLLVPALVSAP